MKAKLTGLSQRYAVALRKHLQQGPRVSLRTAQNLGRQAAALGLETLDVAMIHKKALASLELSSSRDGIIKQAEIFFIEAITPIEKTHRAELETNVRLRQLNKTLSRRTADLATSNRSLKQGIVRRKAGERALKKSEAHHARLLKESGCLEKRLRHLTQQILSAQEKEREQISRELHDEIAQTLLGIHVRLLTLKNEATVNTEAHKKEIVNTQRLVKKSVKTINRYAREFGKQHDT
jgi:two-component system, NarL family, sensor histidine kinase DegS